MTNRSQLLEKWRALREGRVPHDELYFVLHEFGNADFRETEADVGRFLTHDDADLRYIAVNVLTLHWDMSKYRNELERILVNDKDPDVRRIAAVGLGHVLQGSRDSQATRLLIEKLRQVSEDVEVRQAAFDALLVIWLPATRREKFLDHRLRQTVKEAREQADHVDEILQGKSPAPLPEGMHVDWDLVAAIEKGRVP